MGFKFNFYLQPNQTEDKFHRPKLILMKKIADEHQLVSLYIYRRGAKK
jgi:hypothetical protein